MHFFSSIFVFRILIKNYFLHNFFYFHTLVDTPGIFWSVFTVSCTKNEAKIHWVDQREFTLSQRFESLPKQCQSLLQHWQNQIWCAWHCHGIDILQKGDWTTSKLWKCAHEFGQFVPGIAWLWKSKISFIKICGDFGRLSHGLDEFGHCVGTAQRIWKLRNELHESSQIPQKLRQLFLQFGKFGEFTQFINKKK